jgi:hypothetical protein
MSEEPLKLGTESNSSRVGTPLDLGSSSSVVAKLIGGEEGDPFVPVLVRLSSSSARREPARFDTVISDPGMFSQADEILAIASSLAASETPLVAEFLDDEIFSFDASSMAN